jgi:mannosyltransferase
MTGRSSARDGTGPTWLEGYLLPITVTLLGMGLYLWGLDSKSLWFDELGTLTGSGWGGSWLDAVRLPLTIPTTPKPPLSFIVTRLSLLVLGDYVFVLRWPSALFATLTIPLVYALGKALFDRRVGLLGAFLLAIAPLHVRYAQEARMYAMFAFLSVLNLYLFWRAVRSTDWRWWFAFAAIAILNLYTHLFALLTLGLMTLFALGLLVWRRRQPQFPFRSWHFAAALTVILLAYAPMVPFLTEGLSSGEGLGGEAAPDWTLPSLVGALRLFSGGVNVGLVAYAFLFALATVVLAAKRRDILALAFVWVALPVILVLAMPFGHQVRIRFFLFALPVYLLLVAYGLTVTIQWSVSQFARLRRSAHLRSAAEVLTTALLLGLLGVLAIPSISSYYAETKQEWRDAIRLVDSLAEPGDKILVRHVYHQKGVLFYTQQWMHGQGGWTEANVQVLPRDLTAAFPVDDNGRRWLIVPERGSFLPGGALDERIQPHYHLLPPIVLEPSSVPQEAQLIAPTSFRPVAVVQAVRSAPPSIRFWAEETALNQTDCTILHWEVENVRDVYLDGEGVVGQGARQVCPNATTHYELKVIHRDGTVTVHSVEILVSAP